MKKQLYKRVAVYPLLSLLFGFAAPKPVVEPIDSPEYKRLEEVAGELQTSLSSNHWIGEGKYVFLTQDTYYSSIEATGSCGGQNPASPYGFVMVPSAPNESTLRAAPIFAKYIEDHRDERPELVGLHSSWRMQNHEAIVIFTITPPESRYFSYVNYLWARNREDVLNGVTGIITQGVLDFMSSLPGFPSIDIHNERFPIFSSLPASNTADSILNNDTIKTMASSEAPFNSATIMIITPYETTDYKLRTKLTSIMKAKNISFPINSLVIPAAALKLGYDNSADEFANIMRVAYPSDEAAAKKYRERTPIKILRIVPNAESLEYAPFKAQDRPRPASPSNENYLQIALNQLNLAVRRKLASANSNIEGFLSILAPFLQGKYCMSVGFPCIGDIPDTTYDVGSNLGKLGSSDKDFVIAIGVNHVSTGKAKYSNLSAYNLEYAMGIASMSDTGFGGSVDSYLSDLPIIINVSELKKYKDKLFAIKVSRKCFGDRYCIEVPTSNDPVRDAALGVDDHLSLAVRAYRSPISNTGPSYNDILPAQYIVFSQGAQ